MNRILAILALTASTAAAEAECKASSLEFILLEGDAQHKAIEDDIRADLAVVGIEVTSRTLAKDDFNAAMVGGDYDMVFSETWGAPYDPHSYVSSWTTPDEAHFSALKSLPGDSPLQPDTFEASVKDVLATMDEAARQDKWTAILTDIHTEVLHLPLWGKRIPSVTSRATLEGYQPGHQQFDYPIWKARAVGDSKTIKVSPGAQTGLFTTVGRLDPHSYRPNEFFSNNWVYEGLTQYGANGAIEGALATSWESATNAEGGETFRFTLREGVTFHDGKIFDCAAVKLNFDHVWAGGLTGPDWHGWYGLPGALSEWSCDGEVFVLSTSEPYYPLLQELTYIRPLRMLSPNAFIGGGASDPFTQNSCPTGWGTVDATEDAPAVTCAGTSAVAGTGPWKFIPDRRVTNADGQDDLVVFEGFADYWAGAPDIEELHIVRYDTAADVYAALEAGELDAVLGSSVLDPADVRKAAFDSRFDVLHGAETQTVALIMNIEDKDVRKTVVHAVNKVPIIDSELTGFETPTGQTFSQNAPYCDVDLTPKFDYDLEKAKFLNCPEGGGNKKKSSGNDAGLIGGLIACAVVAALFLCFMCFMASKEKAGEPVFAPVSQKNPVVAESANGNNKV